MILLKAEEICALSELEVNEEYPPALAHHREIAKAQLMKVANHIRDLPTDGHDKWYYYHQDLAEVIEKECE